MRNVTFEQWKALVDLCLERLSGLDSEGYPDCPYSRWYAARVHPLVAARRVLRSARSY